MISRAHLTCVALACATGPLQLVPCGSTRGQAIHCPPDRHDTHGGQQTGWEQCGQRPRNQLKDPFAPGANQDTMAKLAVGWAGQAVRKVHGRQECLRWHAFV